MLDKFFYQLFGLAGFGADSQLIVKLVEKTDDFLVLLVDCNDSGAKVVIPL
jgi:hypothetical protein